jgi:hypothetical protein
MMPKPKSLQPESNLTETLSAVNPISFHREIHVICSFCRSIGMDFGNFNLHRFFQQF